MISGFSVSLSSDGTRVAIGAPLNDGNGSNAGHVRVYEYNGTAWAQLGTTSTARRPMINRASRSPCPAMARGWRLGRFLTTATAITQATCGSMSTVALLGPKLGTDIDGEAANDQSGSRSPCPAMAHGWRLGRL